LFHSFGQFNIQRSERATFTGPASVANIFSRVTGGTPSLIDGRLQVNIPGASLYLLNPSGVMFGPQAQLHVSGSFHVSTANGIRFSDGATFSAHLAETSQLTVAPPVAFGFLDRPPARITIQGSRLAVQEGNTFSVTGGDITMAASQEAMPQRPAVVAPSGRIYLTSVAAPGEVQVEVGDHTSRLTENRPTRLGAVQISDGALVSASGQRGGAILVEARTVTLTNGAQMHSSTVGAGRGGDVIVRAQDAVTIDGFGIGLIAPGQEGIVPSLIATSSQPGSTGDAGSVRVDAQRVTLTNGAQMQSGTVGAGRGGDVIVRAQDAVIVDGFGGGLLSLITANSDIGATGNAGSVRVEAHTVTATNGAQISSVTFGVGQGGSVTVRARERVTFRGTSPEGEALQGILIPGDRTFPSGAFVNSHGAGAPGMVEVAAPEVMLAEGGRISSLNIASAGAGGTVIVRAADILAMSGVGSGLRTRSFGPGQGGDITVNAGTVRLTEGADLSAASMRTGEAAGSGNAGQVTVTVRHGLLLQGSFVTTAAPEANGGDITVAAQNGAVRLTDSHISAEVNQEEGRGGNVTLTAAAVILERSQVLTRAGPGTGGDITIDGAFVFDGTFVSGQPCAANPALSCLDASGSVSGRIDEGSPVDTSGITSPLPHGFTRATELLRQRCAARRRRGEHSSFVPAGRDGVPLEPGSMLPSPPVRVEQSTGARSAGRKEHGSAMRASLLVLGDDGRPQIKGWHAQEFLQRERDQLGMWSRCR
jgi:filamentous hemagglutinin family protein